MKRESEPTKKRKCAKPLQLARKRVKKEVLPFPEEQRDEFYGVEWCVLKTETRLRETFGLDDYSVMQSSAECYNFCTGHSLFQF